MTRAFTRGLVLGKFAPFHRGHQLLVERSLASTDETVVLVYDSPDVTRVPLATRAGWIRRIYRDAPVRVIEGHGAPSAAGHAGEIMRLQEDYIRGAVPAPVTHFFSSEWYGGHVSRALGAKDCRVDEARAEVPVSGTALRREPFKYRRYVAPEVYPDLIRRVVLLGAESTGKTTLAAALAREFSTGHVPEYGREFWERHHAPDGTLSPGRLVELAREHRRREDVAALRANRLLFVDTDARITRHYARWYPEGRVLPELEAYAGECDERYHLAVLCGDEIAYVDDGTRAGAARRREAQAIIRAEIVTSKNRTPWVAVHGSLAQRIGQISAAVIRHELHTWC